MWTCTQIKACYNRTQILAHMFEKHKYKNLHYSSTHRFHVYDSLTQQKIVPLQLPQSGASFPSICQLFLKKSFSLLQSCTKLLLLLQRRNLILRSYLATWSGV